MKGILFHTVHLLGLFYPWGRQELGEVRRFGGWREQAMIFLFPEEQFSWP